MVKIHMTKEHLYSFKIQKLKSLKKFKLFMIP